MEPEDNNQQTTLPEATPGTRNRSNSFSVPLDFSALNKQSLFKDDATDAKKKSNWFVRAFNAIKKPIMQFIYKVVSPIKVVGKWFLNTIPVKILAKAVGRVNSARKWFVSTKFGAALINALTSKALWTAVSVVSCSLGAAGITLFGAPIAATTAFALGVTGLSSVAVKAAMESYQIRSVRRVEKESNLLVSHRNNKTIQDHLLKLQPELERALQGNLYTPNRDPKKKSMNTRYNSNAQGLQSKADSFFRSLVKNMLGVTTDLTAVAVSPGAGLHATIQALGSTAYGLLSDGKKTITMDGIRKQYKNQIDEERNKDDTPSYNNLRELKQDAKNQELQTEALKRLIAGGSYKDMSPEQTLVKFNELKHDIRKEQIEIKVLNTVGEDGSYRLMSPKDQQDKFNKLLQEEMAKDIDKQDPQKNNGNFFVKGVKGAISVVKDIGRLFDPSSKYNSPGEIKVEKVNDFTKRTEDLKKQNDNNLNEKTHNATSKLTEVQGSLKNDPQLNEIKTKLHNLEDTNHTPNVESYVQKVHETPKLTRRNSIT